MTAARAAKLGALAAVFAAAFAAALARGAPAQESARIVAGRVVRAAGGDLAPVPGVWVVLHRVGPDTALALDSVRTGATGAYHLRYRAFGRADALYFAAARWGGIAYFSPALRGARVSGEDAEITVFDTVSGGAPLRERGRHVIVLAPRADGSREVVEVYEISNDGTRTRVAAGDARPAWSAAVPAAARELRAGQSEVSAGAIVGADGRVEVFAPFAPGLKQLSFTYRLPAESFPLALPPARDTLVLEVLLEEPGAAAAGGGLRAADSVTVGGRRYARWLSPAAPPRSAVRITAGGVGRRGVPLAVAALVIAMGGAMLAALYAGLRRGG